MRAAAVKAAPGQFIGVVHYDFHSRRPRQRFMQCIAALTAAPATSREVAERTGMPPKTASSVLCVMFRDGVIFRRRLDADRMGRPSYVYSLS